MKSITAEKSLDFAVEVVNCAKEIRDTHKEYIMSKQFVRCGTAIGASVWEAQEAESGLDFIHKLKIALKETNETRYWLILLSRSNYIDSTSYNKLSSKCIELYRLLTSSINTKRKNLKLKKE